MTPYPTWHILYATLGKSAEWMANTTRPLTKREPRELGCNLYLQGLVSTSMVTNRRTCLPLPPRIVTDDGGDPVTWSASPSPDRVFNTRMFSARGLSEGTHTLIMEVAVDNSETWIDYLEVVVSSPSTRTTVSRLGTQTITAATTSSNRTTLSPGVIVGVSIGGTRAVLLAVLCLLLFLRRRRVSQASAPNTDRGGTRVEPLLLWDKVLSPPESSVIVGDSVMGDE
ncbi:hypothetical protein PQX77_011668 [Marasmius sp. AFHP31]|nr:hypothetical protein PQX77_011668 [Marasmius sp. AFHP31]